VFLNDGPGADEYLQALQLMWAGDRVDSRSAAADLGTSVNLREDGTSRCPTWKAAKSNGWSGARADRLPEVFPQEWAGAAPSPPRVGNWS